MGLEVHIVCDKCGEGYKYENEPVSISWERKRMRRYGWQIGEKGWFCPKCRTTKIRNKEYSWDETDDPYDQSYDPERDQGGCKL